MSALRIMILVVVPVASGCRATELDLRGIDAPIQLNPSRAGVAAVQARRIGAFRSSVLDYEAFAAGGSSSSSTKARTNPAQVDAFELVGGRSDRGIVGLQVDFHSLASFMLFGEIQWNQLDVAADLVEWPARAKEGHP